MKRLLFLFLLFTLSTFAFSQKDDISLFNSKGKAIAYIDTDDLTIYLWDGKPVAYLSKSDVEFNIYGFNGRHLGWFIKGIIRDHEGDAVGSTPEATNTYKEYEHYKGYKEVKPYKSHKQYAPYRPYLSVSWSVTNLKIFLLQGIDNE